MKKIIFRKIMNECKVPIGQILGIQAYMPSSEDIRRRSVLKIEKTEDVHSSLLGVTDWAQNCGKCDAELEKCAGHFGHFELPIPIFRIFFIHHAQAVLNNICFYCGKLRLPKNDPNYKWIKSLEPRFRLANLTDFSRCLKRCGCVVPEDQPSLSYKNCGKLFINFQNEDKNKMVIKAIVPLEVQDFEKFQADANWKPIVVTPYTITECLKHLNAETLYMLGVVDDLNLPVSTMWEVLPCPSHNTRSAQSFDSIGAKKKTMHSWTKLLCNIHHACINLKQAMNNNTMEEVNLTWYKISDVVCKCFEKCFKVGYLEKQERDDAKLVMREERDLDEIKSKKEEKHGVNTSMGPVESAWRKLNEMVAAFHSCKHEKFGNKESPFCAPPKSVESRFTKQKLGRWRGNVIVRRVEHAMRGVLEGSYILHPKQLLVPMERAMLQTFPEHVTRFNRELAHKWITNGPYNYPGANFVILKDGRKINLIFMSERRSIDLDTVAIVERHLISGDIGIVNRQPTLHRPSIFGVYFVIGKESVFRLNYSTFKSLGADCDGDEVAVHVPQTQEARAEAIDLMGIQNCIMKGGNVWVNFVENTIIAAYLMTKPNSVISYSKMVDLVSVLDHVWEFPIAINPNDCKSDQVFSGHSIISLILPTDLTMEYKDVKIHRGKFICGQITESILNGPHGILANMARDIEDRDIILDFIHAGYLLFQKFIQIRGLSVGYYDGAMSVEDMQSENTQSENAQDVVFPAMQDRKEADRCYDILSNYIDKDCPKNNSEEVENHIREHIDIVTKLNSDAINKYHTLKDRGNQNGMLQIIGSGAKGSQNTLNVIAGRVCQMFVLYKRLSEKSSYFLPGKQQLQACGFVPENYALGVSLSSSLAESFFGCESVIVKHKGTSTYGYTLRKLTTCMLGIIIDRKKQCVDTNKRIIWSRFGNDGFDANHLQIVSLPKSQELQEPIDQESQHLKMLTSIAKYCEPQFRSPINFVHLWIRTKIEIGDIDSPLLLDSDYFDLVNHLWESLLEEDLVVDHHTTLKLYFYYWLGSVNMRATKMGKLHVLYMYPLIVQYIRRSVVVPGDSIGVITSQEMGEPFSQMSLKIQNLSGKFREVFSAATRITNILDGIFKNNRTNEIYLLPKVENREDAVLFGLSILRTSLSEISKFPNVEIFEHSIRVCFILDRDRTIERMCSAREISRNIAIATGLELCYFETSYANEQEWFINIMIPFQSYFWSQFENWKIITDIGVLAQVVAYNLFTRVVVHGFPEIANFTVDQSAEGQWVITTTGSALAKILTLRGVDVTKTTSNDCQEMYRVFGLRAARKSLETELSSLFRSMTDSRHIKLVSYTMIRDLSVQGMKINQTAELIPMLQRAAYEQAKTVMSDYCTIAERDNADTICGAVLCNKRFNSGTGSLFEVITESQESIAQKSQESITTNRKPCDFVGTFKVDGLRLFVCFLKDGAKRIVTLKDRNNAVWTVSSEGLYFDPMFEGTILDGDLVRTFGGQLLFVAHDLILSCGKKINHLRYDHRIEIARELIFQLANSAPFGPAENMLPLNMHMKQALPSLRPSMSKFATRAGSIPFLFTVKPCFAVWKMAQIDFRLPFAMDGFIFTSLSAGISAFRNNPNAVFKLKPVNTIDVIIERSCNLKISFPLRFKNYQTYGSAFMLGRNKKELEWFSKLDPPSNVCFGSCYECQWESNKWVITKKRDKQPNTISTILSTLTTIEDNIQLSDICKFEN